LFRLAHPEVGEEAQGIEDQFELLGALLNALGTLGTPDNGQREAFLDGLDAAYAQQIDEALTARLTDAQRPAPITALAMRGAIRVLRAAQRQEPLGPPARKHNSSTGRAMQFFADWFDALRQPGTADLQGIKLQHQIVFFHLREEP